MPDIVMMKTTGRGLLVEAEEQTEFVSKPPGAWAGKVAVAPARSAGPGDQGRGGAGLAGGAGGWKGWSALEAGTGPGLRPAAPYRARAEWPRGSGRAPACRGGRTGRGDWPAAAALFFFTFLPLRPARWRQGAAAAAAG